MPEGMCPASFCNSSSPWRRFFTIMDQGISDKDILLPLLLAPIHGKTKYTLRGCRVHRWRIVSLTSGNLHWSDTKYHRALESERGHSSSGEAVAYTDCVLRPSGSVLVKCFVLFSSQMIDTQCYYKNKWSNSRYPFKVGMSKKTFLGGLKDLKSFALLKSSWERQCFCFSVMKRLTLNSSSFHLCYTLQ